MEAGCGRPADRTEKTGKTTEQSIFQFGFHSFPAVYFRSDMLAWHGVCSSRLSRLTPQAFLTDDGGLAMDFNWMKHPHTLKLTAGALAMFLVGGGAGALLTRSGFPPVSGPAPASAPLVLPVQTPVAQPLLPAEVGCRFRGRPIASFQRERQPRHLRSRPRRPWMTTHQSDRYAKMATDGQGVRRSTASVPTTTMTTPRRPGGSRPGGSATGGMS